LGRYKWRTDSSGRPLNDPVDTDNHLIDPLRYVALHKLNIRGSGRVNSRMPKLLAPSFGFASFNLLT